MAVSRIDEAGLNVTQYGNRNLIINGAMLLAQRGTSASVTNGTNEGYQTLDRWRFNFGNSAGGACTVSQDTDVPSGYGFSNSYKVDVTTADTSIASTHHVLFGQRIEAQDLRNSGWNYTSSSSYLTLSFWIKSNKTGVYCVSANLSDVGSTFRFVKEVTINDASTWEYKTVKIFGDSSAVINNDSGLGMDLEWNLVTAADRDNATDNAWHTADGSRCTSNQVNFFDSTSNNLWITGVQLEVGDTATPFEHRNYGDELARCQRYYQRFAGSNAGIMNHHNRTTTARYGVLHHPVEFRATPTLGYSSLSHFISYVAGTSATPTSIVRQGETGISTEIYITTSANGSAGQAGWLRVGTASGAYLDFDAEL